MDIDVQLRTIVFQFQLMKDCVAETSWIVSVWYVLGLKMFPDLKWVLTGDV